MNSTFGTPISEAWQTTLRKPKIVENKFMKKNIQNQLLKPFSESQEKAFPTEKLQEKSRVVKFTNSEIIDKLQHLSDHEIEMLLFENKHEKNEKIETFKDKLPKLPKNEISYTRMFALLIIAAIFSN